MDSQTLINDFAKRSFRDVADQDYIAARMSYKAHLREPFLWSSLQAIEKYLKAILLFNGQSAKGVKHNLKEGLKRVERIQDLSFSIPDVVREFIEYLNKFGSNRYLEYSTYLKDHALLTLDKSVWCIRRYCQYMRGSFMGSNGEQINLLPLNIAKNQSYEAPAKRYKYKISGGLLEEILRRKLPASEYLVWHNFFYGRRTKKEIKNHPNFKESVNPTLALHPEIFDELARLTDISCEVRNYFRTRGN